MHFNLKVVTAAIACLIAIPTHGSAQEREWQLDAQGEDAFLIFGVPNTTDIGISLWCKIGQKDINIFAPLPATVKSSDAKVALKMDDKEYLLQPKFNIDQGKPTLEAELNPRDELLAALNTAERVGLHIANHTTVFPTAGANFYEFDKLCTTAPISN